MCFYSGAHKGGSEHELTRVKMSGDYVGSQSHVFVSERKNECLFTLYLRGIVFLYSVP